MFFGSIISPPLHRLLPLLVFACAPVEDDPVAIADDPPVAEWVWTDAPMAWGTWGDERLALARREDRPILIYFAAPGCEGLFPAPTPALRQLVEEDFVGIRVDPFKRPDIARHYDAGGWPALVVALPDGRVFARAVDIPPPNVEAYLRRLALAYEEKRAVLVAKVRRATARQEAHAPLEVAAVYRVCAAAFDSTHGGFGGPTKFLEAPVLRFLLAYAETRGVARARQMARQSLDAILDSPLGDGGGFRAYSHTPNWRAPARERDALDQAAMLHLLLEARQPRYTEAAQVLFDFVERDLYDASAGAFRGRQVGTGASWWTDPTLYADRQAALIVACLALAEALGGASHGAAAQRAAQVALNAGDALIARCIDADGGVWHSCAADGGAVTGLLVDQAAVALALWELREWSGAAHFAAAVGRVAHFMERQLGGRSAFYNRVAAGSLLPRFFSHRDDGRPAGNALVLEFYGRRGDAERLAALAGGPRLAPDRAYGSWARAVLRYGGMAETSL
ncbi:MAG: DUF255 domain-containing protein [Candidatus Latescibacterota bacterium]|nr:DUF255 domain-containing protein [Candidatus Latescibacterota bacterium]